MYTDDTSAFLTKLLSNEIQINDYILYIYSNGKVN